MEYKKKERVLKEESERKKKEALLSTACIAISITLIVGVMISNFMNINSSKSAPSTPNEISENLTTEKEIENKPTEKEPVATPQSEATTQGEGATQATNVNSSQTFDFTKITMPVVSNEITMAFSYGTTPVYSKTLLEYRSDHTGCDIKAGLGEEVRAVYDGTVISVSDDDKLGTMITIDHGLDVKTVYANLESTLNVKKGDSVKAGDILGKVGKSAAFEISDGTHLHFAIIKNNEYIDPAQFLK